MVYPGWGEIGCLVGSGCHGVFMFTIEIWVDNRSLDGRVIWRTGQSYLHLQLFQSEGGFNPDFKTKHVKKTKKSIFTYSEMYGSFC